jgi:biotin carboxylase
MPQRLMILGANDEQTPLIAAAKARGIETVVIDANPSSPGVALADVYIRHDLMDAEACIALARQRQIDGVCTAVLSLGMRTVGAVAQALSLPGLRERSALYVTDKAAMRARLEAAGVPSVPYRLVRNAAEAIDAARAIGLPVVIKPPDGSGSRGVRVVHDIAALPEAFADAAAALRSADDAQVVLIEQCITGQEYGVNGFFFGGETHLVTVRAKRLTELPYRQELAYVYPPALTDDEERALADYLTQIARALELEDVPFHADMMRDEAGAFRLIELGARLPGYALSYAFVPYATRLNTYDIVIDLALGNPAAPLRITPCPTAMVFLQPPPGVLEAIPDPHSLLSDRVRVLQTHLKPGDTIVPVTDGTIAMHQGFVVATGKNADDALSEAEAAASAFCSRLVYKG